MCKAQALRKAYFDLLRGIDQCVISSSKYGTLYKCIIYTVFPNKWIMNLYCKLYLLESEKK